jgi:transposase
MEVIHPRCAGLDVHKETVVACVRRAQGRKVSREVRSFGTSTRELLRLLEWLQSEEVTHVAMEATGVYWKPVWHILESSVCLLLSNARDIKQVPGRKSDVSDAEWIADLLAHGLLRSSFVPPTPVQELRDLTRTRKQMVRQRTQNVQRLQKVLEDANIKLDNVISDILGQSGRAMLEAMIAGESDPARLAELAHPRVKASQAELREALEGRLREHHRFLLQIHLEQIDSLDRTTAALERRIEEMLAPFHRAYEHLQGIPGVSERVASVLIAETGGDMKSFPTAGHLVSWAGLCPRMDQSAGKRRNTRTRPQHWLKTTMVQAAWSAVKAKDSYYRAQYLRLKARRGAKKAIVAVAASMLTAAYHIMQRDIEYQELGADHFERRNREKNAFQLIRRLQRMGYEVKLQTAA